MEILYTELNIFSWTEILISLFLVWENAGEVGSGGKGSLQPPQKSINSHQWMNKDAMSLRNTSEYFIFQHKFQISSLFFICLRSMSEISQDLRLISLYHQLWASVKDITQRSFTQPRGWVRTVSYTDLPSWKKHCPMFTLRKKEVWSSAPAVEVLSGSATVP